jgi:hypothetical protein
LTDTERYRILNGMTYQSVSDRSRSGGLSNERSRDRDDAEAIAIAWLAQRLHFEAWLARVRKKPGPEPGSGLAAAA